jgi:flavin-dependent dehydrogenase
VWRQPRGRLLLAGDAAGLVNPMTGEGIYYAVVTGVLAGRSAVQALDSGSSGTAGDIHRAAVRSLLGRHLRHTSVASRLVSMPAVAGAGIRAASSNAKVFDDLVEVGLGQGLLTARIVTGLTAGLTFSR